MDTYECYELLNQELEDVEAYSAGVRAPFNIVSICKI